ncbi:MAG: 1-deoxy-D-xylulose-5-phosphate reductoisomerase [Planctomycetota bacterium]|nr:1-deoxy-D-xylulose-5-phosphate reductoisomerase [Planctomycetota bacterium]
MKPILVLGSTGSIGLRTQPGAFEIAGLAARSSWRPLLEQVREFRPGFVAMTDEEAAEHLRPKLPPGTELLVGPGALERLVAQAPFETCVHGVVGAAGLRPSVAVLEAGRTLALANKESLVVAGQHLMQLARDHGATLVPVDSEHSAIFQCLRGESIGRVRRILLTASGGPFRALSAADMAEVTPEMALRHPNWDMGPRITVGSATLMNKALEVIEVHHLFGLEPERIEVVIHPQSLVHSMVEFVDGSVIAQMGPPDMRGPIHYALHHPNRRPADLRGFDLDLFRRLDFSEPDPERFPALALGFRCIEEGADAGSVLNAADEVAVEAFLQRTIPFPAIPRINALVLDQRPDLASSLDDLLESDARARSLARREIAALSA